MVDAGKALGSASRAGSRPDDVGKESQAGPRWLAGPHRQFPGDVESQPGGGGRARGAAGATAPDLAATVCRLLATPSAKSASCSPASGRPRERHRPFRVYLPSRQGRLRRRTRSVASRGSPRRSASISTPTARPTSLRATSENAGHAQPRSGPPAVPGNPPRGPARRRDGPISGSSKASPPISKRSANIAIPQAGLYYTIGESSAGRLPAATAAAAGGGVLRAARRADAARQRRPAALPRAGQALQPVGRPGGVVDGRRGGPLSRAAGART